MPTSTLFNNYGNSNEQQLMEDLICEAIRIFGIDMYYLPVSRDHVDPLYFQSDIASYNDAFQIEMYVKNYEGFQGQGNLFAQFGVEIRDEITFTVAKRAFDAYVGHKLNISRPREGDIIYYPLNAKSFEISYVENKPFHYPLGTLPSYDLYCKLYEYSNERFNTGIPEIDALSRVYSTNIFDRCITTTSGQPIKMVGTNKIIVRTPQNYPISANPEDNDFLSEQAPDIVDFSETDPFAENWRENL